MSANLDLLLKEAVALGASDIHLSTNEKPIFRIHGNMKIQEKYPVLTLDMAKTLVAQSMDDELKKSFFEAKDLDFAYEIEGVARFRVNAFFTTKGINAVFRIIPSEIISFDQLHLPEQLRKILELKKGMVVVTGPTGSGKSTTLAAIIDLFNEHKRGHIVTIEDPVEFVHKSKNCIITHRETKKHTESFASALRAVTRQDPDIVLVGEMRDLETISLAITAAETGALVFGTLHTSSAPKTINRIIDVFPAEQQNQIRSMLSESIQYVVAQALLKKKGGGRVAALEIMIANEGIRNQIRDGETHQLYSSMQSGKQFGMQTIDQALKSLLEKDQVTYEEAILYAYNKSSLDQWKPGGEKN